MQTFVVKGNSSTTHHVNCSVLHDSAHGAAEFIMHTAIDISVFERHHCLFTDNKQVYTNTKLEGADDVRGRLHDCTTDIHKWCASRWFLLDTNKMELAWSGQRSRLNKLANMEQSATVSTNWWQWLKFFVTPSDSRSDSQTLVAQLIHSFVPTRQDSGNSVLVRFPVSHHAASKRSKSSSAVDP